MSQHSTPWGRSDRRSTTGSGSLRASRLGAHHSRFRSDHSYHDNRFYDPSSTTPSNKRSDSDSCVESISSYVGDRFTSNHRSGYQWRSNPRISGRAAADEQESLVLDPSVVAANFAHTSDTGTPSLTSSNNFINFCDTVSPTPDTNGLQIAGESCNPAPMGRIPTIDNLPSVRITQPANLATLQKNTSIGLQFHARNLHGGVFVNPATRYLSTPQDVDETGMVIGHFHVVIEELDALNSTIPLDIRNFVFFSVIQNPVINGSIQSSIPNGLPVGFYRATVTTHAASYQPVLAPIAQHGSLNDVAYFTVTADGTPGSTPAVTQRTLIPEMDSQRNPFEPTRRVIARADADADAQSSLTLLSSLVATGFSDDGQNPPVTGQSAAATSSNNFINFCALTQESVPLTDGLQITTGSCNPAPMGVLPASTRLPASKFTYPRNGEILAPNTPMTVGLAVTNLAMGNLANLNASFLAAPQQLDANGNIQGHPFVVVDQLSSFNQSELTDPTLFLFAKGIAALPDSTGVVTTTLPGLPVGFYRVSSIIRATNGQPVLLPILQHGAVDDAIYVTIAEEGALPTNETALPGSHTPSATALPSTTPSPSTAPSHSAKTNVAAIVGGVLAGTAVIVLLLFALWFFLRRRSKALVAMLEIHPVDLSIGGDAPVTQLSATPPVALHAEKHGTQVPLRRDSIDSVAPSYHTDDYFNLVSERNV